MNSNQPLVSIIVPVYNKRRYLHTILNQIAEQTFSDFECILIDDGSTDGSAEICDAFALRDSRFVVKHIPNGGVAHARNVGLDLAAGAYITFIDADDEVTPEYLDNLYKCIIQSGADIVIGSLAGIRDHNPAIVPARNPFPPGTHLLAEDLVSFARIQKGFGTYGWCCAKLLSRELIADTRFTEGLVLAEDFDFYLKLYPAVSTIYYDDKPNYLYRQEAENCSVVKDDDKINYLDQLLLNLRYRAFLQKMNAWSGENQEIVEQLISNYIFFTIVHSPVAEIPEKIDLLRGICTEHEPRFLPVGALQRVIFALFRHNMKKTTQALMWTIRFLRKVKHRISL